MPRCQRTLYRIREGATNPADGAMRWVCPHCDDHEAYDAPRDSELVQYLEFALRAAVEVFGPPARRRRPKALLLLGLHPECLFEEESGRCEIYLCRVSDPLQMRLQVGHEAFHCVCSEGRIFHWTHEMLACLFSVRLLRRSGHAEYAGHVEQEWRREAAKMRQSDMRRLDLWMPPPYPDGFYGRAFLTGSRLVEAVGWPLLARIARTSGADGSPDVGGWVSSLNEDAAARAQAVLDAPG